MSIPLLIAEGQEVARAGLRAFLAGSGFSVVAEARATEEAIDAALALDSGVALLAVRLPGGGGLAALEAVRAQRRDLPIVMLAEQDHAGQLARAHELGAVAYLLKGASKDTMLETLRKAADGENLWTRTELRRVSAVAVTPRLPAEVEAPLTRREMEILQAACDGLTNQQIGQRLQISYETVKEHIQHVLQKTGLSDRTQAAVWAVRSGLV
jgi:DNA-binding NarL/FixJ family response regulator